MHKYGRCAHTKPLSVRELSPREFYAALYAALFPPGLPEGPPTELCYSVVAGYSSHVQNGLLVYPGSRHRYRS